MQGLEPQLYDPESYVLPIRRHPNWKIQLYQYFSLCQEAREKIRNPKSLVQTNSNDQNSNDQNKNYSIPFNIFLIEVSTSVGVTLRVGWNWFSLSNLSSWALAMKVMIL